METREAWLAAAIERLRPHFEREGYAFPQATLRVACGFPSRAALATKRRVGECWDGEATPDGSIHILISPLLSDPVDVLATLVHELIHACIGTDAKHGPAFTRAMKRLGLTGKATATIAGEALRADLETIAAALGAYPHAPIVPKALEKKAQKNRQLKVECLTDAYILRGARATLERAMPSCPLCGQEMTMEETDEGHDDDRDDQ